MPRRGDDAAVRSESTPERTQQSRPVAGKEVHRLKFAIEELEPRIAPSHGKPPKR